MTISLPRSLALFSATLLGVSAVPAANILTIDFDANPGYAYGFNEFYGYGSPNSGGNQAEGAWGATATTPLTESAGQIAGVGAGATNGLQASVDTSGLQTAALEDANNRFGDTSIDYAYWGGSFGTGADPAAISTVNVNDLVFSIDADITGTESAGSAFRIDLQFQGAPTPDITFRFDVALAAGLSGYNTYTIPLSAFTVVAGSATDIGQDFTNINMNLQVQNGNAGFGYDANNVVTVDNLILEQIPEPGAAALGGLAALLLLTRRSRRQ